MSRPFKGYTDADVGSGAKEEMSSHTHTVTRLRPLLELIGRPVRRVDLAPPFLTASASSLDFHHPDPELTLLRQRMPFCCGDYTLEVYQHPREPGHDLLDFVACCIFEKLKHCEELRDSTAITAEHIARNWGEYLCSDPDAGYPGKWMMDVAFPSPAHVLWEISCFGCLEWRSTKAGWIREALARVASGGEVGRWPYRPGEGIGVETTPTLTAEDVPALRDAALDKLIALTRRPPAPHAHDRRKPMPASSAAFRLLTEAIEEDCQALADLCRAHNTFGQAVFPELANPNARSGQMLVAINDGNTRNIFLEADDAWVGIFFETS
ncbi:MAG: hypothetical protein ACI8RZ_002206 [Myxococcota bacterium]|jgi:hypothetical protein